MFLIRHWDSSESSIKIFRLHPNPTEVEYPESRQITVHTSVDGNPVVQQAPVDSRSRKWIWKNYRPHIEGYRTQHKFLQTLAFLERQAAGLPYEHLFIGVWEGETDNRFFKTSDGLPADDITYSNVLFQNVKVSAVEIELPDQGGNIVHETFYMEFVPAPIIP